MRTSRPESIGLQDLYGRVSLDAVVEGESDGSKLRTHLAEAIRTRVQIDHVNPIELVQHRKLRASIGRFMHSAIACPKEAQQSRALDPDIVPFQNTPTAVFSQSSQSLFSGFKTVNHGLRQLLDVT